MLMTTTYPLRLEVELPLTNSPIAVSLSLPMLQVNVGVQTRPSSKHYFALEVRPGCVSHEAMSNGPSE